MPTEPHEDERLLAWVYRWSLTRAGTNARHLRQKNAKALRLAIEQPEREAKEAAEENVRLVRLKREQDTTVERMRGSLPSPTTATTTAPPATTKTLRQARTAIVASAIQRGKVQRGSDDLRLSPTHR
ncbi:Phosphorylated carbohydrates phosphatase [Hordeum vulgare]|nr:Phosphorylated carbohydrates phosphatase [Hordeum vulgare]